MAPPVDTTVPVETTVPSETTVPTDTVPVETTIDPVLQATAEKALIGVAVVALVALAAVAVAGLRGGAALWQLGLGFMSPMVANMAHLGGLVAGALLGWVIVPRLLESRTGA